MFENIRVLTKEQVDETNEVLKSYGLRYEGGSLDTQGRLYMIVNRGYAATYNEGKVANLLMNLFQVKDIVLNGILFNRDSIEVRNAIAMATA